MQRRAFLQATIGAAATGVPKAAKASAVAQDNRPPWMPMYDEALAASTDLELLGIPRSWWHVHHGLHPFSPERPLIIPDHPQQGRPEYQRGEIGSLMHWIKDNLDEDKTHCTEDGICQMIYAASILTQTYRVPGRLEDWSQRMANLLFRFYGFWAQDHLWISSMGWQGVRETVKTMNGIVDWWLILIPGGIDVHNFDETRTHVLITPVFSRFNMPRFYGEFWNFMAKALKFPAKSGPELPPVDPTWLHVSRMDRKRACLFVNQRIAQTLTETL